MKLIVGFLSLCAILLSGFAGDEPKVKVTSVIDGNTIVILDNNGDQYKILLHGIDCPDSGQNFAVEAKRMLAGLVLDKQVTLVLNGKDRYGTRLGEIQAQGIPDPRYELVRTGPAWTTDSDEKLESLKQHARSQGIGIWTEENPTPPWLWRRQQSMLRSKTN